MSKKDGLPLQSSKKHSTKARKSQKANNSNLTPFEILCSEPEQINPAILLAEELMRKGIADVLDFADIERAEETLVKSRYEIARVEMQFKSLVKTPPSPGGKIPIGF